eukprot:568461-Alexandrium_andersonii.AAC.1
MHGQLHASTSAALSSYLFGLEWAEGSSVSFLELAVDFELRTGQGRALAKAGGCREPVTVRSFVHAFRVAITKLVKATC